MKTKLLALCALIIALPSCASIGSAITGQEIPATAVQRSGAPDAPAVLVASTDLALAEQAPVGTIHGLYDAGAFAKKAREVVIQASGK